MMTAIDICKFKDILDDVKKVDSLLALHANIAGSDLMISQYEARKTQLIGNLIDELVSPDLCSPQSFSLIETIIQKFYPVNDRKFLNSDDGLANLAASL